MLFASGGVSFSMRDASIYLVSGRRFAVPPAMGTSVSEGVGLAVSLWLWEWQVAMASALIAATVIVGSL